MQTDAMNEAEFHRRIDAGDATPTAIGVHHRPIDADENAVGQSADNIAVCGHGPVYRKRVIRDDAASFLRRGNADCGGH